MNDEHIPDPVEIRHEIGSEGYLTIQNISGNVELRGSGSNEAVVVARSESGRAGSLPLVIRRTEGGLHIEVEKRAFEGFGRWLKGGEGIEFEVSVPRMARVDINTVSADVRARFLSGEQAYKTVSGDVELDPDGGRVSVTTVSGDVEVRAADPIELSVNTTSGDINVEGAVLSSFEARTVSGDVEFEAGLAPGPLHTVETVSGDLSVESTTGVTVEVKRSMNLAREDAGSFVVGDGAAQLRYRTLSGDCHVENARRTDAGRRHERHFGQRIARQAERAASQVAEAFAMPAPPSPPAPPRPPAAPVPTRPPVDQLEVLRALERGEIDVEEAQRRLQEA